MAKAKRPPTWLEVGIQNGGMRAAVTAMSYAYTWAVTREALGHDPSAEEVAKWWGASERTTYRDQAAFRKAFPMLEDPGRIYASEEAREALAKHAALGDRIDQWGRERRERREQDGVKAFLLRADVPT